MKKKKSIRKIRRETSQSTTNNITYVKEQKLTLQHPRILLGREMKFHISLIGIANYDIDTETSLRLKRCTHHYELANRWSGNIYYRDQLGRMMNHEYLKADGLMS